MPERQESVPSRRSRGREPGVLAAVPAEDALVQISDLIRRVGTTKRVVEHAEARGLLAPAGRTPQGYKLYGPNEEELLRLIVFLYELGFSASRIKALLAETPERRSALLEQHRAFLQRRAAEAAARLRRYQRAFDELGERINRTWRAARRPWASTNEGPMTAFDQLQKAGFPTSIRPAA